MKFKLFALFALAFTAVFAWAQAAPPETAEGLLAYLSQFIEAVGKGDWKVIGGIALMALMVGVRQYVMPKAKIEPDHLPIINAAIAALAFAGMAAISPNVDLGEALKNGLLTSGIAAMAWELGGKLLFKNVFGIDLYKPV